jgi:hypothetical protein
MADDLTAIPGLEERHRRALSAKLGITTYNALAQVDPHAVLSAMSKHRPPPTLGEIKSWQDEARRRLRKAAEEVPGWGRSASFMLIFEQRSAEGATERRLVAEQTEQEPEQPPASWPSWDLGGLDDWLRERLSAAAPGPEAPEPTPAAQAPEPASALPGAAQEPVTAPAELLVHTVTIVDSSGRVEAVAGGRPVGRDLAGTLPGHLEIRVTGGPPGSELLVALRLREPGRPSWSPQAPINMRSSSTADLELSEAAVGRHDARIVAWAPDASAEPTGVDLGSLTIWPARR